jgi:cytochrome c oxidase assembly protein subunit 15
MWIQLGITGILIALLPLAVVWGARDANKYRKLAWITVFLTFDLIMFGAFTRLTDSGLGCPDWPGCYGQGSPLQALNDIRAAESLMPDGPVTLVKAWIEMIHRYLAMAIGVLIIALVVIAWRKWRRPAHGEAAHSPWFPLLILVFVCIQGAFGAWTVTLKLQPLIVTIHLLLGMGLLALLVWLAARLSVQPPLAQHAGSLRTPALAAGLVLAVQIALGGWVSTNYAALACMDYPLCNGSLVPEMDFRQGFILWRELGKTADGEYLPFPALVAIHWMHRLFALVAVTAIAWTGWRALHLDGMRRLGRWLLLAVGFQFMTGIATVFLEWPLALAVIHNGGAALLVLLLTMVNYRAHISGRGQTALTATRRVSA